MGVAHIRPLRFEWRGLREARHAVLKYLGGNIVKATETMETLLEEDSWTRIRTGHWCIRMAAITKAFYFLKGRILRLLKT